MSNTDNADQNGKHAGGRPPRYETVAELDRAIAKYFKQCDPHWENKVDWVEKRAQDGKLIKDENGQTAWVRLRIRRRTAQQPYTVSGLARSLDISRTTLLSYKERPEFLNSIEAAKSRCEEFWEGLLASPVSNGAKFNLINNYREADSKHNWAEKHEVSGPDGAPLMPISLDSAVLSRMQDGTTSSSEDDSQQ